MDKNTESFDDQGKAAGSSRGVGRRYFVKGLIAASPVVMTLSSRSALAAEVCTVSGHFSGNLSDARDPDYCAGLSPGAWKNELRGSTSAYNTQFETVTFKDVFGLNWYGSGLNWDTLPNGSPTLAQVLDFGGAPEDRYEFGAHAVAAYANAVFLYPHSYKMTPDDVKTMIHAVLTMGYYTDPSSGLTLDAEEMVSFIAGTFG